MKKERFIIKPYVTKWHKKQDGSFPLVLSIRKGGNRKYIFLGSSVLPEQWNEDFQRYEVDKRRKDLHPDRVLLNEWLEEVNKRCNEILKGYAENKIDWTLNQFEQEFLNQSNHTGVEGYFLRHIEKLKNAGRIGNRNCYQRTLDMLKMFDPKFNKKVFQDIDLKYVNKFDEYLGNERGCTGNTKKYYIKTLRALLNKAIKDGEASEVTYPFGKSGYSISALQQETVKRYLPSEYIETLKTAQLPTFTLEWVRNLFLFSYYCQGMSFIDVATLTNRNILKFESGKYIAYRRQKTEGKNSKIIKIKISENIQSLLDWFKTNTNLVEDYLTPVVTIEGYEGEQLYNHIRDRYRRFNKHLKTLATKLNFDGVQLSSYVSRHSYAMRLKNSGIPEDVISEALGHRDLSTTKVYLDSFQRDEIEKANEVL